MIDIRTLEIVYWVVKLGGFRRAAEKLHTTQPAISARVAALEAQLGTRLIERDRRRRISVTPSGIELLGYAERILALQGEMLAAMTSPGDLRGTVRLGTSETIVHTWLSQLIRRLHEVYPHVTIDISVDISSSLRTALLAGEVDVAFLLGPVTAPGIRSAALCEYDLAWVARPDLAVGTALAELARWPVITYARATGPFAQVAELFGRAGLPTPRIFANSSLASIVRMVLDGIGVGVIAPAAIGRELASGELRILPGAPALSPLVFTTNHADAPGNALAAAVCRLAHEVARA